MVDLASAIWPQKNANSDQLPKVLYTYCVDDCTQCAVVWFSPYVVGEGSSLYTAAPSQIRQYSSLANKIIKGDSMRHSGIKYYCYQLFSGE